MKQLLRKWVIRMFQIDEAEKYRIVVRDTAGRIIIQNAPKTMWARSEFGGRDGRNRPVLKDVTVHVERFGSPP